MQKSSLRSYTTRAPLVGHLSATAESTNGPSLTRRDKVPLSLAGKCHWQASQPLSRFRRAAAATVSVGAPISGSPPLAADEPCGGWPSQSLTYTSSAGEVNQMSVDRVHFGKPCVL